MKYKVAELEGALLDVAVLQCLRDSTTGNVASSGGGCFSTDWASGGPIIERERIRLLPDRSGSGEWFASAGAHAEIVGRRMFLQSDGRGPTALVAAMRAYVCCKFGDVVELP